MPWWPVVIGLLLLLGSGVLALSVRVRLVFEEGRRLIGLSLGRRTGIEVDAGARAGVVRLAGIPLKKFRFGAGAAAPKEPAPAAPRRKRSPRTAGGARRDLAEIGRLGPRILRALGSYLAALSRAATVEECRAHIEAGFASPDHTGLAFGCYQAALGAGPVWLAQIRYVPVWDGPAFRASGRFTAALPLYRLAGRTVLLAWRLPIRKIIRLARA
ncbi:MAG TPA: hypothetical protein PK186_10515 [candidate division Zixibacteria bacterium]|nr:hypothetical protein [candidate division Zixibacteria bacterium]MDD4916738.1 hypothetical protein [candidate division Zixibacteria bacterium]MDM7973821.1 hypothetical protein [candidate division Zixibacteria bacterium]HOD65366.1 hypothetical protein [candidate division Zixibacteria bacterium]HPC11703.1 hypothetical protein [candidate division Zixibacteria bacterium]